MSDSRPQPRTLLCADRFALLALFAFLLALYTLSFSGLPDNPDAEVEFQTARSLVRDASLALGDSPEARAIVAANFDVAPGVGAHADRRFAWFGVGQALAAVPFFLAGDVLEIVFPEVERRHALTEAYGARRSDYWQHLAVGWRNPLLAAATAALLAIAALRLGASRAAALLAALLYGLCTFAWPQARSTLSDVQATFFLVLACERWLAWRGDARARNAALCAAALSAALLTRVALAPAVACVAIAFVADLRARRAAPRAWCAFFTPTCLGAALFCAANYARFGSLLETGYGTALAEGTFFSYPPHLGLAGLLLAPGKGLVFMAPLLLLAPRGLWMARRHGLQAWIALSVAVTLAVFAPVVCTQTWHGAWTFGPRYVLPAVAWLWPAVALVIDHAREHARWKPAIAGLALLGLSTALPGVLVDHMTHQDLAVQAAPARWPQPGGDGERERDAARFLSIQWDWNFAAPWAHWRIFAQRARGRGESFDAQQLFGVAGLQPLQPRHDRERGWRHFAWVDLRQRLDGPAWIGPLSSALLLGAAVWAWRRSRPVAAVPGAG